MIRFFSLLWLVLLFSGCRQSADRIYNPDFQNVYKVEPDFHRIDEIMRPVDMIVSDDYLVIQNDILPGEHCLFVYDLETLDFLYSFVHYGNGPEEFLAPAMVQNDKDNFLTLLDQASMKLIKYRLTDETAEIADKNRIILDDNRPLQEVYYVNDSILIFSTLDNELKTYHIGNHQIIDTYKFSSNLKQLMGKDYNQSFDKYHFAYNNNKVSLAFNFFNMILIGEVGEDGSIGLDETEYPVNSPLERSLYDNRYYYMYTLLTDKYLFAQYVGYKFRALQPFPLNMNKRRFDMLLEVYSLDKKALCCLDLQHDVLRCKIDEKHNKIYTWNMLDDFDNLIIYDYSEIRFGED